MALQNRETTLKTSGGVGVGNVSGPSGGKLTLTTRIYVAKIIETINKLQNISEKTRKKKKKYIIIEKNALKNLIKAF